MINIKLSPLCFRGGKKTPVWVGHRAFLDVSEKRKVSGPCQQSACSQVSTLAEHGCRVVKYCRCCLSADTVVVRVVSSGAIELRRHSISIVCVLLAVTLSLASSDVFRTASCRHVDCILEIIYSAHFESVFSFKVPTKCTHSVVDISHVSA